MEQEDKIELSSNALAALREFAQDQGIQIQNNDDVIGGIQDALKINNEKQFTELEYDFKDEKDQIKIILKGIDEDQGQTLQSTGLTIWRAAQDLSNYIFQKRNVFAGKQILELGAGLGLVGVLLGYINKNHLVNITDGDEENGQTIELLKENIKKNNNLLQEQHVKVQRLWWGDKKEIQQAMDLTSKKEGYELIFGSDVIYKEEAVKPLIDTVVACLKKHKDSRFYLGFARRNVPVDIVLEYALANNLNFHEVPDYKCSASQEHIIEFWWKDLQ